MHPAPASAKCGVAGVIGVRPPEMRHLGRAALSVTGAGKEDTHERGTLSSQAASKRGQGGEDAGTGHLAALVMSQELCPSPSLAGCRASQHWADLHPSSSGSPGRGGLSCCPPSRTGRTAPGPGCIPWSGGWLRARLSLLAGDDGHQPPFPGVLRSPQMEISQSFRFSVLPQEGDSADESLNPPFSPLKNIVPCSMSPKSVHPTGAGGEVWAWQSHSAFVRPVPEQQRWQRARSAAAQPQPEQQPPVGSLKFKHFVSWQGTAPN